MAKIKEDLRPLGHRQFLGAHPRNLHRGQAHIDGADQPPWRWNRNGAPVGCVCWSPRNSARSSTASATCSTRPSGMATSKPSAAKPPA